MSENDTTDVPPLGANLQPDNDEHVAVQAELPTSNTAQRIKILLANLAQAKSDESSDDTMSQTAVQAELLQEEESEDNEIPFSKSRAKKPRRLQSCGPSLPAVDLSEGQSSEQAWGHQDLNEMGHSDRPTENQSRLPTSKTSRMTRTAVDTFDRRAMDPKLAVYRGDQRYAANKPDRDPKKLNERKIKATSLQNIRESLATRCCKSHGLFGNIMSEDQLKCIRYEYHNNLNSVQRQNFLSNVFFEKLNRSTFEVDGISLCWNGLKLALGVADGTLSAAKTRMVWGITKVEFMKQRNAWAAPMTTAVSLWLDHFIKTWTEKMPHKTCLHLPSAYTKTMIFKMCSESVKMHVNGELKSPSVRLFMQVWTDNFPHVKIPRLNSFSKCNFCSRWGMMKQNRLLTPDQHKALDSDKAGGQPLVCDIKLAYLTLDLTSCSSSSG